MKPALKLNTAVAVGVVTVAEEKMDMAAVDEVADTAIPGKRVDMDADWTIEVS